MTRNEGKGTLAFGLGFLPITVKNHGMGAVSLHGMLDIPEKMKEFVNDYKILLVEARKNDLTFHNGKNRDFFNIMKVILDQSLSKDEKGIVETGLDFGLSESDILERLQKKMNLSLQMAQEYIKMFGKQTV